MEDPSVNLVFILLCVGSCLFGAIISAGFGLAVWIIRNGRQTRTEADAVLQQEGQTYLAESTTQLLGWSPEALADISSHLETTGKATLGKLTYRGVLKSLQQPDSFGRLAFTLQLVRAKGPVLLLTPNHTLQLDFGGFGNNSISVTVNDVAFGSLKSEDGAVVLFDAAGYAVGRYDRKFQTVRVVIKPTQQRDFDVTPRYGAVVLNDRSVAELNSNLIFNFYVEALQGQVMPPLFRDLALNVTPEEESWLLALAGREIVQRITLHVSS